MKIQYWIPETKYRVGCYARDVYELLFPPFRRDAVTADFYISAGPLCRPAYFLTRHKLRVCANPLDWMAETTLERAAYLFRTGFADFFQDIKELPPQPGNRCRKVLDCRNNIVSIHHFLQSVSLEEGYAKFQELMRRRYLRMMDFIKRSPRVAFLGCYNATTDQLATFLENMRAVHPTDYTFINVRNVPVRKKETATVDTTSRVINYHFPDTNVYQDRIPGNPMTIYGNKHEWDKFMRKCRITDLLPRRDMPTELFAYHTET